MHETDIAEGRAGQPVDLKPLTLGGLQNFVLGFLAATSFSDLDPAAMVTYEAPLIFIFIVTAAIIIIVIVIACILVRVILAEFIGLIITFQIEDGTNRDLQAECLEHRVDCHVGAFEHARKSFGTFLSSVRICVLTVDPKIPSCMTISPGPEYYGNGAHLLVGKLDRQVLP
jgi:hypothetical protein